MASDTSCRSFRIVPDDVLFFRDGKPSTVGDDHFLRSVFPPYPSVVYGALRTRRLFDRNVDLAGLNQKTWHERLSGAGLLGEIGEYGGHGTLAIRGPWLIENGNVLFPAPADLALVMDENAEACRGERANHKIARVLRLRPEPGFESGSSHSVHGFPPLAPHGVDEQGGWHAVGGSDAEPESSEGWYLRPAGMQTWLAGGVPKAEDFIRRAKLWVEEVRVGVGLNAETRTAKEHQLYSFGFVRLMRDVSIGFDIQGSALEASGVLRVGGEGRTATLEPGPPFPHNEPPAERKAARDFWVYLATPALFAGGAYPPGFSNDACEGNFGGVRCRLKGAVVRSHVHIGGWDIAQKKAKALRRAVPAGSVFLFERLDEGDVARQHGRSLNGFGAESLNQQGFGLTLVGAM